MGNVLLAASPGNGMAETMLPVIDAFLERDHRVIFLAEAGMRRHLGDRDVRFVEVPTYGCGTCATPTPQESTIGFAILLRHRFLGHFDAHWLLIRDLIERYDVSAVVTDPMFLAASAIAGLPRERRPAVIALGGFPLPHSDPQLAPYGLGLLPGGGLNTRLRNTALRLWGRYVALRRLTADVHRAVAERTGTQPRGSIFDLASHVDVWAQLTVPQFEYRRRRLSGNVEFIGPLRPLDHGALPAWWDPDESRPLVHVRYQPGTPIEHLLVPAVQGLAREDVLVVVTGAPAALLEAAMACPLPSNVRIAECVPYSMLLAHAGAAVKSGDYVRTQYALRWGVPVVLAGTSEEHVETAARVEWAGVGVNLRTTRPDADAIREAVLAVLADSAMRHAAIRLAAVIARFNAEERVCEIAEAQMALGRG